jgi:hypothetical protein
MKRILLISAMLLASVVGAQANHYNVIYHDLIRPNGQARDAAIGNANLEACFRQTGDSRVRSDSPRFKRCMAQRGYRWVSTRLVRDFAGATLVAPENPDQDWSFHDLRFWGWD